MYAFIAAVATTAVDVLPTRLYASRFVCTFSPDFILHVLPIFLVTFLHIFAFVYISLVHHFKHTPNPIQNRCIDSAIKHILIMMMYRNVVS